MPNILILTSICLVLLGGLTPAAIQQVLPKEAAVTKVIAGHNGRHSFVLRIVAGPFRRTLHHLRITSFKDKDGNEQQMYWLDGKPEWNRNASPNASFSHYKNWYGTDGGFPDTEFYSFEVKVDGKPWKFPKQLWQDCYEPYLSTDPADINVHPIQGRVSKDGKRITIEFSGSDAAGLYGVTWHLRKDGRVTREVEDGEH